MTTVADIAELDRGDPLAGFRDAFVIPEGLIYLDGNSLGAASRAALAAVERAAREEWAGKLIASWNDAGWFTLPSRLGDRIGRLIGAAPGETVVSDTTSINVFKAVEAAVALRPGCNVIVAEASSFPTDLYMLEGVRSRHPELKIRLEGVDAPRLEDLLDGDVSAVLVNHVDYRSGALRDMAALTARIHAAGAIAVWDLCHSAGALEVDLNGAGADLAVGCSYKYLNGGPGAPAFVFAATRHLPHLRQPLTGWWAHARPFAFDLGFEPDPGIRRMQCGTQAILSMRALDGALSVWDEVDMVELRRKSVALTGLFIDLVEEGCAGHGLQLVTPRQADARGSQVSFLHEGGYAVMQELIARGVVGDFRRPNLMRFGFAPLYLSYRDVWDAAETLRQVLDEGAWRTRGAEAGALVT